MRKGFVTLSILFSLALTGCDLGTITDLLNTNTNQNDDEGIQSIEISGTLSKTTYKVGESWDSTGLVVEAKYSEDNTKILKREKYTFVFDPKLPEENLVKVGVTAKLVNSEIESIPAFFNVNVIPNIDIDPVTKVENVSLSETALTLNVGETAQLYETVYPQNADIKYVVWSSDDDLIASVNSNGLVTARGEGTTTITVITVDGNKTANCQVTVQSSTPSPTFTTVSKSSFSGVSGSLDDNISYEAKQGSAGTAPAVNAGQLRIYQDGGLLDIKATSDYVINEIVFQSSMTTSYAHSEDSASFSQSTSLEAEVDETISGLSANLVTIKCTGNDKNSRLYLSKLEVTYSRKGSIQVVNVSSISVSPSSLSLIVGATSTLLVNFTPSNATNKNVTWVSNNPSIASINNGKVTAITEGTTTIIATSVDGKKTSSCTVTVKKDQGGTTTDGTYYDEININSSTLLSDLQSLNARKRKSTVGYSAMGTSASASSFKYTDYDPATVKYDSQGRAYGTKILSFYSGRSTDSFNREHVWPKSRGGSSVDADIFMTRPTISEENSDRGNSSYVEGMCHSQNGWDPVTAFEKSLGVYTNIRGECARIIFYCVVANSNLKIVEGANTSYKNSIGDINTLVKWSVQYSVNDREQRRNNGGQGLQGNRNPFVDHPEYVCKIWGTKTATTKSACGLN